MLYHCYTGLEGYVLGGLKLKTQQKTHAAIQWFKFLSYPFTISHSVCACVCVSLCFFNWGLPFPVLFVVDVAWFTTTWRTVRLKSVNLIEASLIPALLKLHWKEKQRIHHIFWSYYVIMQSYAIIIQYESNSIKHEIDWNRLLIWKNLSVMRRASEVLRAALMEKCSALFEDADVRYGAHRNLSTTPHLAAVTNHTQRH